MASTPPATQKRQTQLRKRNACGELRTLMQTVGVELAPDHHGRADYNQQEFQAFADEVLA